MLKLIIGSMAIYLALVVLMFFMQRSLLYLPGKRGLTTVQAAALSLEKWPDEPRYRGYLHDPPDAKRTIVIFHGNAGEAANRRYYLDTLKATRSRIILAEYPGYGQREGSPSEKCLVNDARRTVALAADAFPHEPLIVIGESLGCRRRFGCHRWRKQKYSGYGAHHTLGFPDQPCGNSLPISTRSMVIA